MKRFAIFLGMALCMTIVHAQNINSRKSNRFLSDFRKSVYKDFYNFRKQSIAEFAEFVRNPWKEFEKTKAIPVPKEKKVPPIVITEAERKKPVTDRRLSIKNILKPLFATPQPKPIEPIKEVPVIKEQFIDFTFYGTTAKVRFDVSKKPKLSNVNESTVSAAIKSMKSEYYDNMLIDCLALRDSLNLSDWAYLQMLKQLSNKIAGESSNESTLLLAYMYMQSGYKMRLASDIDWKRLYMLYQSPYIIYNQGAFIIDNDRYYALEELPSSLRICLASFPKEKGLSLFISSNQKFGYQKDSAREISSEQYPEMKFSISVNKNLLEFYNSYPSSKIGNNDMTHWAMYANTPMDKNIKEQLYPKLKEAMKGMTEIESAERLLNLVQTGFEYEYDDKVWGEERAFFAEETLGYPFCDCEDRSILFTRLIRDILGLKCILIYYPGHLASAVEFTDKNIKGDHIILDGHKYIIADATYIRAKVGQAMPKMDNSTAQVILLE